MPSPARILDLSTCKLALIMNCAVGKNDMPAAAQNLRAQDAAQARAG